MVVMKRIVTCLVFLYFLSTFTMGQTVVNGDFAGGIASWGCTPEVNPDNVYGGPSSTNIVAEIDDLVALCQTISGFSIGTAYNLTYVATRRLGGCPGPNPADIVVTIDGLNTIDSRSNTVWAMTNSTYTFTATATTLTLTIIDNFVSFTTCGYIIDDIAISVAPPFAVLADFELEDQANGEVMLGWKMAEEVNQVAYRVEKSLDGVEWTVLQEVPSLGSVGASNGYQLVDQPSGSHATYYRLSVLDQNGAVQVLGTRQFVPSFAGGSLAYPNPSTGLVWIESTGIGEGAFQIVDALGRVNELSPTLREAHRVELDLARWAPGVYVLRTVVSGKVFSQKLLLRD
jgi:hypothetical protein